MFCYNERKQLNSFRLSIKTRGSADTQLSVNAKCRSTDIYFRKFPGHQYVLTYGPCFSHVLVLLSNNTDAECALVVWVVSYIYLTKTKQHTERKINTTGRKTLKRCLRTLVGFEACYVCGSEHIKVTPPPFFQLLNISTSALLMAIVKNTPLLSYAMKFPLFIFFFKRCDFHFCMLLIFVKYFNPLW
jgi:hypothetical protein